MYGTKLNGFIPYAYITIGSTAIFPGSIAAEPGLSVVQTLCGEDGYSIGGFSAAEMTVAVATSALPQNIVGQPITVYMGYGTENDDEEIVYSTVPVGVFYTTEDKIVTKGLFTTITAYDASYYAQGLYIPTGTPGTVAAVMTDVLSQAGLALDPNAYSGLTPTVKVYDSLAGLSYRDVIAHCALLLGANACITREGKVTFRKSGTTAVETFTPTNYRYTDFSLQSNAAYTMGKLVVEYTHEVTTGGGTEDQETEEVTDTFTYQASGTTSEKGITVTTNDIRTQAETNALGRQLFGTDGFSMYGYSLKVGARPELDLGDMINLVDDNEVTRGLLVLTHTMSFNGSLSSTFGASVPTEDFMSLDTTQRATLSDQVQQLSGLTARVNRLMADLVVATNAKFEHVVTNVLEADEFKLGVGTIVDAKIDNLEVNSINGYAVKNSAVLAKALSQEMVETALGVKVFYQVERPTATKSGDIWYVTVADKDFDPAKDVIKQWDGTDWVAVKDNVVNVFMANSITAREIVANTITANEIDTDDLQANLVGIGNPTGRHIAIDSDSLDIMDGDDVLASFGEEVTIIKDNNSMSIDGDGIHLSKNGRKYASITNTTGYSSIGPITGSTITASRGFEVLGHDSPIGTTLGKSRTSNITANTTWKSALSLGESDGLTEGVWMITALLSSDTNASSATSIRANLYKESAYNYAQVSNYCPSGQFNRFEFGHPFVVNSGDTVHLNVYATASIALGTNTTLRAVRIA